MSIIKKEECCGTCKWHKREVINGEWVCMNKDSDNCAFETEYKDSCDQWESR